MLRPDQADLFEILGGMRLQAQRDIVAGPKLCMSQPRQRGIVGFVASRDAQFFGVVLRDSR